MSGCKHVRHPTTESSFRSGQTICSQDTSSVDHPGIGISSTHKTYCYHQILMQNQSVFSLHSSRHPYFGTPMHSSPTLGINHQSPLIYCQCHAVTVEAAGNQSPIPFDILPTDLPGQCSRLGINHQSPLIYWPHHTPAARHAGNQSPIPFDILQTGASCVRWCWESITNPL